MSGVEINVSECVCVLGGDARVYIIYISNMMEEFECVKDKFTDVHRRYCRVMITTSTQCTVTALVRIRVASAAPADRFEPLHLLPLGRPL